MNTSTETQLFAELGRIVSHGDPVGLGSFIKVAEGEETPVPCPCPYKKPVMRDDEKCRHCNKQLKKDEALKRPKGEGDEDEDADPDKEDSEGSGLDTNQD